MLHVILLILKILGIILLSILCLVLLILAAVLFIAVSYRVRIQNGDTFHVTASVGWLFRGVTVNYTLDKAEQLKQELQVCLFGIPIMRPLEQKAPKKVKKEKPKKEKKKRRPASEAEMPASQTVPEREKVSTETPVSGTKELPVSEPVSESVQAEDTKPKNKKKERVSIWEKICRIFRKIDLIIENLCDRVRNIQDTIRGLLDKKDKYLDFWNQEEHRRARGALWKEVLYLLKKIRPKKVEGKVLFGFKDPSVTGKCLGAASVLYAWYPKKFELVPDFENEVLECDVWIKGRTRFYIFLCILCRLFFHKDVRQMYQNWKQL